VDELGNLLDRTVKREEKISSITDQLEEELGYLTAFLDNLASRRPKGRVQDFMISFISTMFMWRYVFVHDVVYNGILG